MRNGRPRSRIQLALERVADNVLHEGPKICVPKDEVSSGNLDELRDDVAPSSDESMEKSAVSSAWDTRSGAE